MQHFLWWSIVEPYVFGNVRALQCPMTILFITVSTQWYTNITYTADTSHKCAMYTVVILQDEYKRVFEWSIDTAYCEL